MTILELVAVIRQDAVIAVDRAPTAAEAKTTASSYTGKNGALSAILGLFKWLDPVGRVVVGDAVNEAVKAVNDALAKAKARGATTPAP